MKSRFSFNNDDSHFKLYSNYHYIRNFLLFQVKEPVVCSNQHVFCQPCIKLWLEKNHQCPACRVPISADNPCRPVLGKDKEIIEFDFIIE